jgi:hypothetical protein
VEEHRVSPALEFVEKPTDERAPANGQLPPTLAALEPVEERRLEAWRRRRPRKGFGHDAIAEVTRYPSKGPRGAAGQGRYATECLEDVPLE